MTPLIRNIAWKDAKWSKFKRDYMWNNVYYLRRSKFAVYQLATTFIGVGHVINDFTLKHYSELSKKDIPGFPGAQFRTHDIVATIAFNIVSCSLIAMVFTTSLIFDLFWPERVESNLIQRAWKFSAASASLLQLIGSITATIVFGSHQAGIQGVSPEQESIIRQDWRGTPLVYHQYTVAVIAVVMCWIGWWFTLWSTVVMWQSYAHNNTYGPFADHSTHRQATRSLSETSSGPV